MGDLRSRADALDSLADHIDAVLLSMDGAGPDLPDDGPWLEPDPCHSTGYEAVARYARELSEVLRDS